MIISQYTFNYIGAVQQFTVPDTAYYRFEVWGAQGGSKNNNGAKGGYSKGRMYLIKGQTIYIYVGACPNCNTIWNGGGYSTYSGGDASDIRIGGTSLSNRVIVAGGGGGTGLGPSSTWNYIGGIGGGLTGGDGTGLVYYIGHGGTQTSGGIRGSTIESNWYNESGGFGQGGNCYANSNGGGGGGGWYGGGAGECGGYNDGGGGGGSSYIEGVLDGSTIAGVQTGNGKIIISLYARNTIVLEKNNKFYIPDKSHFDIHTKTFKEVTTDEAISFPKDFEYTYDISFFNAPFVVNSKILYPSDIIDFSQYRLCVIGFEKLENITLNYTPSSVALSKTTINIRNRYTPFDDNIFNPYLDVTGINKTNISYRINYDYKNRISNICSILCEEILKDNFYLSFNLDNQKSLLSSVTLYNQDLNNYKQIRGYFYKVEIDYVNTYMTFNNDYSEVLINKITRKYFKYLSDTLNKF